MFRKRPSANGCAPLFLAVLASFGGATRLAGAEPVPAAAATASQRGTPAAVPGAPAGAPESPAVPPASTSAPTPPSPAAPPLPLPAPAPAPATVVPAPAPAPGTAASPPPARAVTSPGEAVVHIAVSHKDAWLEMRSYVDGGDFLRICRAPCDLKLQVEGREARVTAPGMTTSNVFRFDGGDGTAGVRVDGGSASARRAGILTLAIGIPLALAGMGLFAQGHVRDSKGLTVAGVAGLSAGGLGIAVSLPLLLIGTTHVKNAKGSQIALGEPPRSGL